MSRLLWMTTEEYREALDRGTLKDGDDVRLFAGEIVLPEGGLCILSTLDFAAMEEGRLPLEGERLQ